jgi:hypothetical protein
VLDWKSGEEESARAGDSQTGETSARELREGRERGITMQYTYVGIYDDDTGQDIVDGIEADSLDEAVCKIREIALRQNIIVIALFEGGHQDLWPCKEA